jgi:hypothetical protein
MNDTILIIAAVLIIALGIYELSEQSDNRLRPSTAQYCMTETINYQPGECLKDNTLWNISFSF